MDSNSCPRCGQKMNQANGISWCADCNTIYLGVKPNIRLWTDDDVVGPEERRQLEINRRKRQLWGSSEE